MRVSRLEQRFVDFVPERADLQEGVLYISVEYVSTCHLCCCGCGNEVTLPLDPAQWELTYDGRTVSMHPSVGNWSFPCRSHYWIRRGQVRWAPKLTDEEVDLLRAGDRRILEERYETESETASVEKVSEESPWWKRLLHRRSKHGG